VASRRGAEDLIRAGRVRLEGRVVQLGELAHPDRDRITVDGRRVRPAAREYWLAYKPSGMITTRSDPGGRPRVVELLPPALRERLFPVGRLDLGTEGLVLLTNDGELGHALLHPSLGNEREYRVTVRGNVSDDTARRLEKGVGLADGVTAPARVSARRHDRNEDTTVFHLVLREGRKRQIRRSLAQLGHPVRRLIRVRMGPLRLQRVAPGRARRLTTPERKALLAHAARLRERAGRASRHRAGSSGRQARKKQGRSRSRARVGSRTLDQSD
jgi:23S rRNA pseudouridine2605 synthase